MAETLHINQLILLKNKEMKKLFFVPLLLTLLLSISCKKKECEVTPQPVAPVAPVVYEPTSMNLEVGDNIQYTGDVAFQAGVGQEINLTLKNIGQFPVTAMGHNVVVLVPGTNVTFFAQTAAGASAPEYMPAVLYSSVLAHTNMLGPDESQSITFTLNTPGVYDFTCSFPGHYGTSHGTITVSN